MTGQLTKIRPRFHQIHVKTALSRNHRKSRDPWHGFLYYNYYRYIYFRRIENMTKRLFALMIWNKTENRFNKQPDSVMRSWKWRQWKYNFVQIWKYFKLIEKHLLQYRILYQRRIFASYINEFSRFWSDNLARGFTNKTITSQFEKCVV